MLHFTKHEKSVLLSLAVIVLCGSVADAIFKSKPEIARSVNAQDRFVNKTNVNTATFDELVRVPYIGEVTARSIMRYRREKGRIHSLEEIRSISGVYPSNYIKMAKYLKL